MKTAVKPFCLFFLILLCFTMKNDNLIPQERTVLSKLFFGKMDSGPLINEFKPIFYIIKNFLTIDENLKLIVSCGKNFNLKKLFTENDIVDFPNLSFCLIDINSLDIKQLILFFKNSKISVPLENTFGMNIFLEMKNIDCTEGAGQALFDILQSIPHPSCFFLKTLNQEYLLFKNLNQGHVFLLTLENNDITILLRSDIYSDDGNHEKNFIQSIGFYKNSDNFLNPCKQISQPSIPLGYYYYATIRKCELPDLRLFEFSDTDLILLEKSRAYSKKTIGKILLKLINIYQRAEIFVFEKLFSFLISKTNEYYYFWYVLYRLCIGQIWFIPKFVRTQIIFFPLLVKYPNAIFVTSIIPTTIIYFQTIFFVNKNITTFQIPKNEYRLFIVMKVLKKGFKYNFVNYYFRNFIFYYFFVTLWYIILKPIVSDIFGEE